MADAHCVSPAWVPEHDTGNLNCWCVPDVLIPCPECQWPGHIGIQYAEGCWRCGPRWRGMLVVQPPFDDDETYVVIHHTVLPEGQGV